MAEKDKRLIRGFQLMAAYHHQGNFVNTSYHALSQTSKFTKGSQKGWEVLVHSDWENRKFEQSAKGMYKLLLQGQYFVNLGQWRYSISDLLPDGAVIGYQIALIRHWELLGKPGSSGSHPGVTFMKNAYILLDRLIYQAMSGMWGGSGDSAAQTLIGELNDPKNIGLQKKVSDDDWIEVWTNLVCGNGSFVSSNSCCGNTKHKDSCPNKLSEGCLPSGKIVSKKKETSNKQTAPSWVKKVMIHYYCTTGIKSFFKKANYSDNGLHWDHIIPDTKFTEGSDEALYCNNIANFCALPENPNIKKSAKFLTDPECKSGDTKVVIEKYAELNVASDGPKYDSAKKAESLVLYRGKKLMDNFISKRSNHF